MWINDDGQRVVVPVTEREPEDPSAAPIDEASVGPPADWVAEPDGFPASE